MAASRIVNKYDGVPFRWGCLTFMRVGSIGMHFVDVDGIVLTIG